MADAFKFEIDASGAVTELNNLTAAATNTEKSTASLRSQLRAIQQELQSIDPNTEKFQELSKQAGAIKDKINDAAEATRANAGPAFETLGNNFSLLTQRIASLDFEGVGQSLKGVAGSVKSVSFKDINAGISEVGKGFGALGKALLTNPFFLIASAVLLIITNFDKLYQAFPPIRKAFDALTAAVKWITDAITAFTDSIGLTTVAAENELKKTQSLLDGAIEQAELTRRRAVADAKRNNTSVEVEEKAHFARMKAIYQQQLDALDKFKKANGMLDEEQLKKQKELKKQLQDVIAEEYDFDTDQIVKAREKQEQLEIQRLQKAKQRAEEAKRIAKQKADEEAKSAQEVHDLILQLEAEQAAAEAATAKAKRDADAERLSEIEAIQEEIFQASLSPQQREVAAIRDSYFEKIALAEQYGLDAQALIDQQNASIAEINQKYRDEENEKNLATIEQRIAEERALRDAKVSLASDTINALAAVNDSFSAKSEAGARRQFNINKGLQIAQALIQTYQSATAAYASQLTIPSPDAPIRAAFAAGAAVAAGLAQVNKIRQTQFNPGGGGGGSANSGGSQVSAPSFAGGNQGQVQPQFNTLNTGFINNRPDQITTRTYVLASDVASQAEARERIRELATL